MFCMGQFLKRKKVPPKKEKDLKKAVAYCRISTDEDRQKYSLTVQNDIITEWAAKNDHQIVKFFFEDHSAKDANRPEFQALLKYCKKNKEVESFLVVDYYRYSRNIAESYKYKEIFKEMGVNIIAVQQYVDPTVPENLLMEAIYLAQPEVENKRRSINVIKGMREKLMQGYQYNFPAGYKIDKNDKSVHLNEDSTFIKRAFEMVLRGEKLPHVSKVLNELGFYRSPKQWDKMLKNPTYAGLIKNALLDDVVQGKHPSLVKISEFERVQYLLTNRGNFNAPDTKEDNLPLKNKVCCSKCSKPMTGYYVKKKQKKGDPKEYYEKQTQIPYYKCNTVGCKVNVSAKHMHAQMHEILSSFSISPDMVDVLKEVLTETFLENNKDLLQKKKILESQALKLRERIKSIEDKFIDDLIDKEVYNVRRQEFKHELEGLIIELESIPNNLSNPQEFIDYSLKLMTKIGEIWNLSNNSRKLVLLSLVFPKGLSYSKDENSYRTPEVNQLFSLIDTLSISYKNKKGSQKSESLIIETSSPQGINIEPLIFNQIKSLVELIS